EADVPFNKQAEISPEGRERPLLLRRPARELREVAAHVAGHDVGEFEILALAPVEQVPHGVAIGFPRVAVRHLPIKEVGPCLGGRPSRLHDKSGQLPSSSTWWAARLDDD